VHKVPFFVVSRAVYNSFLEAQNMVDAANAATPNTFSGPVKFLTAVAPANAVPTISLTTFLPFPLGNGYVLTALNGAGTTQVVPGGLNPHVPVLPNEFGMDAILDITVPKSADSGIVIDLTDITSFADGIYDAWNPAGATAAEVPAILQPVTTHGAVQVPTNAANVTPAPQSSFPMNSSLANESLSAGKLLNKPRVNVYNRSSSSVYLSVGKLGVSFETVSNQLGVRPNTKVSVDYNPQTKQWSILDTNARA
jgi:hypothetical protein